MIKHFDYNKNNVNYYTDIAWFLEKYVEFTYEISLSNNKMQFLY